MFLKILRIKNNTMKKVQITFHFILTLACFIHVLLIGYKMYYPNLPEIKVYKRDLKEIEFPFSFLLCAYNLQNDTVKYSKFGYKDEVDFFRGRSKFNNSLVGWGGHAENGSHIGTVEGLIFD